jgi:hypothetical protein
MSELLNELEAEERAVDKKKRKKERLKQNQKMRKEGAGADEPAPKAPAAQTAKYGTLWVVGRGSFVCGAVCLFPCLECLAWIDALRRAEEGDGQAQPPLPRPDRQVYGRCGLLAVGVCLWGIRCGSVAAVPLVVHLSCVWSVWLCSLLFGARVNGRLQCRADVHPSGLSC